MEKYNLELTQAQFLAVIDMADTIEAMIGTDLEFTKEQTKNLRLFDRMMERNNYRRKKKLT